MKKIDKNSSPRHSSIKVVRMDGTRSGLESEGPSARVTQSVMKNYEDTPLTNADSTLDKRKSVQLPLAAGSVDSMQQ